ncbi:MAG: hypothetical protein H6797_02730 [Candidatus Nomurabacteria bacterium]|nr:MAG: hypothetical protein H6797_02730 [Candidatus Nomurabacteria bacterium]
MSEHENSTNRKWSIERESIERTQRREMIDRVHELAAGPDSSLQKTNGLMDNYNIHKLSTLNKTELGLVRAALFKNGLFLSFHLEHEDMPLQLDLSFGGRLRYIHMPVVTTWPLVRNQRSEFVHTRESTNAKQEDILRNSLTSLISKATEIVELEASGDTPWQHAYTKIEVSSSRRTSGIVYDRRNIKPEEFGISPKDGEPYL